jgi:hypothetical protein
VKVCLIRPTIPPPSKLALTRSVVGGKVKPLKAAKKDKKNLDEDDKAYLEKKRAGMYQEAPRSSTSAYH